MRPVVAAALFAASATVHAAGFTLTSPTIKPGSMLTEAQVFKGFGCEGKNTSPALKWSGAPSGTKRPPFNRLCRGAIYVGFVHGRGR